MKGREGSVKRLKVYIASGYSLGDAAVNVRTSMEAWDKLFDAGFAPFCPLWSHLQDLMFPRSYEDWMESNDAWIDVCDAMLRLPGESSGADRETAKARAMGIPVFETFKDLFAWQKAAKNQEKI